MSVISVSDLTAGYGGLPVVRNLNLRVDAGEVVALLGPNGAGRPPPFSRSAVSSPRFAVR